jgi:inositol-pentakisphosphate 2-kinase
MMPSPTYIKPSNAAKLKTCRYCMHQILKKDEGRNVKISKYCPLDLFSGTHFQISSEQIKCKIPGSEERITRALLHLIEFPQNNLKIYHNGKVKYADSSVRNQVKLNEK